MTLIANLKNQKKKRDNGENNLGNVFTGFTYLLSIILATAALGLCVVNEATPIMFAISITALLLNMLLIGGIYFALTDKRLNLTGAGNAATDGRWNYDSVGARGLGIGVGGIILLFIIGGAMIFVDVASSDYLAGGVLALSGLFALMGGFAYRQPELQPVTENLTEPLNIPPPVIKEPKESGIKEKEIIREKEVIIKIRCPYCQNLYDETLDKCPHCGAKR